MFEYNRKHLIKKSCLLTLLMCACWMLLGTTKSFGLNREDMSWDFSNVKDPGSQGWSIFGFSRAEIRDGELLHLVFDRDDKGGPPQKINNSGKPVHLDKSGKPLPALQQGSYFKSKIKSSDFCAFSVRLRAQLKDDKSASLANGLKLRLECHWNGEKNPVTLELPVKSDGELHIYTFDLAKANGWDDAKHNYVRTTLLPVFANEVSMAELDLDYLRFLPTALKALQDKLAVADVRIASLEQLSSALTKRKITLPGSLRDVEGLRKKFSSIQELGKQKPIEAMAALDELEKKFFPVHKYHDRGRRLIEFGEALSAIGKSLTLRSRDGQEPNAETAETFKNLRTSFAEIKKALESKSSEDAEEMLEAAEKGKAELWNSLCSDSGESSWQLGVSDASFGRYGWRDAPMVGGRERVSRGSFFRCANKATLAFDFAPVGAEYRTGQTAEINWVGGEFDYIYERPSGSKINWKVRHSLLAPGQMIETDAQEVTFSFNVGKKYGPTALVAPYSRGPKFLPFSAGKKKIPLSENWLLLLCDNGYPAMPYLLTFQHQPDYVKWSKDALIVGRKKGVGAVGIACPYGVWPLPADFSKDWKSAPAEVVQRCRLTSAIMTSFPYNCDEFFQIDEEAGTIRITNLMKYLNLENDWKTSGLQVAPIPPVLAFAVSQGYPATLPKEAVDCKLNTVYGPYLAVKGDRVEYTLPIPDLRNPTAVATGAFPKWREEANEMAKSFYPYKTEYRAALHSRGSDSVFPAWSLLDGEAQDIVADNAKATFESYFKIQNRLGTFDLADGTKSVERTEPHTSLPYRVWGWNAMRAGKKVWGDITNFVGFDLNCLYNYCKYTGDWQFARAHWTELQRIFSVCPRRCDWAVMGQSCMEYNFLHTVDMATDSWCAPMNMSRIAKHTDDKRMADLALYMAAKQAVPLVTAFSKRKWDREINNRWDPEVGIPEAGYTEGGYIVGEWHRADFNSNFIIGCVFSLECINLYRDFCPEEAARYEYTTLEKYCPNWNEPRFIEPGKSKSENAPGPIARHLVLREALGETTENLEAIMKHGLLEDVNEPLSKYVPVGGLLWLKTAALSTLVGRDAPCKLAEWGSARLLTANYKSENGKVTAQFSAPQTFTLEVITDTAPESVLINGQSLETTEWSFSEKRNHLSVQVKSTGNITIVLNYKNWETPVRTGVKVPEENLTVSKEQLICRNERIRKSNTSTYGEDYQVGDCRNLDLSTAFNMSLSAAPVGAKDKPAGWLGLTAPQKQTEQSGLSALESGIQVFRGVPFRIANQNSNGGRAAIGLSGKKESGLPKAMKDIKLNVVPRKLFFLHTAALDDKDEAPLMRYVINYADGTSATFMVRPGHETGDWLSPEKAPDNARLAVKLKTVNSGQKKEAGLYIAVWENTAYEVVEFIPNAANEQRPLRRVASINIEAADRPAAIAVLAITAEGSQ